MTQIEVPRMVDVRGCAAPSRWELRNVLQTRRLKPTGGKPDDSKSRTLHLVAVALLACVPTIVRLIFYPMYPGSDDAFIHATLARNIAAGVGWGINAHEVVNMSTAPLYTAVLSLIALLTGDFFLPAIFFSCALSALAVTTMYFLASLLTKSLILRLMAAVLAAFNVHLWRWNGTLMETMLATVIVLVAFYCCVKFSENLTTRRLFWLGAVHAAAILVRPELTLLMFSTILFLRLNTPRGMMFILIRMGFATLVTLFPWLVFSQLYFHSIVPTTYAVKTAGFHLINPFVVEVTLVTYATAYLPLFIGCIVAIVVAPHLGRGERSSVIRRLLPFVLFPFLLFAFYYAKATYLESPARYFLPALCIVPIVGTILLDALSLHKLPQVFRWLTCSLCIVQVGFTAYWAGSHVIPVLDRFQGTYVETMSTVADYLKRNCSPTDRVLVEVDIGALSFFGKSAFRIADGAGLASPELHGLSLKEKISLARPLYVVQTLGKGPDALSREDPRLVFQFVKPFASHGIRRSELTYYCNVYRVVF